MSRPEPRPDPGPICRECGATNAPGASECWLCQRRDWRADDASRPVKPAGSPGVGRSRRGIAIAIVAGTVAILGLGMLLDIWQRSDLWGLALVIATLAIPVGLIIWARVPKRLRRGQPMTDWERAAAGSTIAAGVILVTWLVQASGFESIGRVAAILAALSVPAGLITAVRARRRQREGRPMSGLQVAASVVFLAVLLPPLVLASLVIAFALICLTTRPLLMP